jgi:uncharacterized protein YukJ
MQICFQAVTVYFSPVTLSEKHTILFLKKQDCMVYADSKQEGFVQFMKPISYDNSKDNAPVNHVISIYLDRLMCIYVQICTQKSGENAAECCFPFFPPVAANRNLGKIKYKYICILYVIKVIFSLLYSFCNIKADILALH